MKKLDFRVTEIELFQELADGLEPPESLRDDYKLTALPTEIKCFYNFNNLL